LLCFIALLDFKSFCTLALHLTGIINYKSLSKLSLYFKQQRKQKHFAGLWAWFGVLKSDRRPGHLKFVSCLVCCGQTTFE